ncbi:MAG TPA: PIG-L deacetylase family protein [Steroidobacteraceae bacterium]|nr:PIG-L deacetylase family protein [Steroidobacteraceae bacterium]
MLELTLPAASRRATRILCLGAHCDDIEIGCGGTLLKLLARGGAWEVTWVVFAAEAGRAAELRVSAARFLRRASRTRLITHGFRDAYFPAQYGPIKDSFAALKRLPEPDLIFTHQCEEWHQDHRLIGELTWNAFRAHLVLEYEIPKYDGQLACPNAYVPLSRREVTAKTRALLASYPSQRRKPWFSAATFEGLLRLRGIESGCASGWAEGFCARKLNLG